MKDFIKIKKIKIFYFSILFLVIFLGLDFFVYHMMTNESFGLAKAYESISFSQTIKPFDPIEKSEKISEEKSRSSDLSNADYRFVVKLPDENDNNPKTEAESTAYGPIIEFKGQSMYPNSIVYIEINSNKIITSTTSDGNGDWSWANYAEPLENGNHTLEMYNISPFDVSGKRDVFVEKYAFAVNSVASSSNFPQQIALSGLAIPYKELMGDDDLGDKLSDGGSGSAYVFQLIFPVKEVFDPGETIKLQLLFKALKKEQVSDAKIKYEIFRYTDNNFLTEKVSDLEDDVSLGEENSFAKFIQLKDQLISGGYVLKATAIIDGDHYVQTQRFSIAQKEVMKIGTMVVTEEKITKVMTWNILAVLLVIIILTMMIALEYRRFIRCAPIDEDFLKQKGFLS